MWSKSCGDISAILFRRQVLTKKTIFQTMLMAFRFDNYRPQLELVWLTPSFSLSLSIYPSPVNKRINYQIYGILGIKFIFYVICVADSNAAFISTHRMSGSIYLSYQTNECAKLPTAIVSLQSAILSCYSFAHWKTYEANESRQLN